MSFAQSKRLAHYMHYLKKPRLLKMCLTPIWAKDRAGKSDKEQGLAAVAHNQPIFSLTY